MVGTEVTPDVNKETGRQGECQADRHLLVAVRPSPLSGRHSVAARARSRTPAVLPTYMSSVVR